MFSCIAKRVAGVLFLALGVFGCAFSLGYGPNGSPSPTPPTAATSLTHTVPESPESSNGLLTPADSDDLLLIEEAVHPSPAIDTDDAKQAGVTNRTKLFRDWSKPDAVIVFSGQQHGYLEPCGCSPQFQKGGLARRFDFIQSLQKQKWPLVMAELGGLLDDHSQQHQEGKYDVGVEQSLAKLEIALEALQQMGFVVVNLAPEDINVPNGFVGLMATLLNMNNPPQPRSLNANLKIDDFFLAQKLVLPHITRKVGSLKLGFTGMVGEAHKDRMNDPELKEWRAPEDALRATLEKLKQESDVRILMLYGPASEARALAEKFSNELDVIIHTFDSDEPSGRAEWWPPEDSSLPDSGKTMLVTIGSKGKYTGAIGIFAKEKPRMRFELVPLDDRFSEDKNIRELLDVKYIEKLAALKLVESSPKRPFDPAKPELSYLGSQKCAECHPTVFEKWSSTRHATALKTLVEGHDEKDKHIAKGKQVNPECVLCHTTGFSFQTGYDGTPKTAHLGGNGCENCHSPGSEHVKIYSNLKSTKQELARARKMVHLEPQTADSNLCSRCHDGENDPAFDLDTRWPDIEHGTEAAEDQKLWPSIREKLSAKDD